MVNIISLHCPVCGAPITHQQDRCDYCGSALVIRHDLPRIDPASLNTSLINEKIAEFRETLDRDPDDISAHYGLGVAYYNLRLTEDAVRELETSARLQPENASIQAQLAVALRQAERDGLEDASARLARRIAYTLRLDPDNVDALQLQSEQLAANGNRTAALDSLEQAYHADPARIRAAYQRALTARARELSVSDPTRDRKARRNVSLDAVPLWKKLAELDHDTAQTDLARILRTAHAEQPPELRPNRPARPRRPVRLVDRIMLLVKALGMAFVAMMVLGGVNALLPQNDTIAGLIGLAIVVSWVGILVWLVRAWRNPADARLPRPRLPRFGRSARERRINTGRIRPSTTVDELIGRFETMVRRRYDAEQEARTGAPVSRHRAAD